MAAILDLCNKLYLKCITYLETYFGQMSSIEDFFVAAILKNRHVRETHLK